MPHRSAGRAGADDALLGVLQSILGFGDEVGSALLGLVNVTRLRRNVRVSAVVTEQNARREHQAARLRPAVQLGHSSSQVVVQSTHSMAQ